MNTLDTQTFTIVAVAVVILALLAAGAWLYSRKRQSDRLMQRFGPEYGRAVDEMGSRAKARKAARFNQDWKALQGRFVDNPKGVLVEADQLVRELMGKRGYPMGDFESRAADISVDHPAVVEHYRAAQAIALRDKCGDADTEEMRKGVVHYRALFDELLEVSQSEPAREMEVHS